MKTYNFILTTSVRSAFSCRAESAKDARDIANVFAGQFDTFDGFDIYEKKVSCVHESTTHPACPISEFRRSTEFVQKEDAT